LPVPPDQQFTAHTEKLRSGLAAFDRVLEEDLHATRIRERWGQNSR
jgi:hypothetical protein